MGRKEGIKAWLERSRSLPLTVVVSIGNRDTDLSEAMGQAGHGEEAEDIPVLQEITRVLGMYSSRWMSAYFFGDLQALGARIWEPFACLTRDELPWLQEIRTFKSLFAIPRRTHPAITASPLTSLLAEASAIRTLRTDYEPIPNMLDLPMHWRSLQEIDFFSTFPSHPDPASIISKLSTMCPSLVSLKITLLLEQRLGGPLSDPSPASHWPCLRDLRVALSIDRFTDFGVYISQGFQRIFQRMRAPALSSLSIQTRGSAPLPRHDPSETPLLTACLPFQNMLSQSGDVITHLTLDGIFLLNEQALERSLKLLPSLTSLRLEECLGGRLGSLIPQLRLSSCLFFLTSSADVCPDLAQLDIVGCGFDNIDQVVSFAKARSNKLNFLSVDFGYVAPDVAVKIASLTSVHADMGMKEGIRVDWKWQETTARPGNYFMTFQ
ncbi:hypothetical protein V5O48_015556 [Marasmius crinis-equi]|uniref:Uncharacterized protein n=1 Tax=Marasmius crinis-equi TaxID=585013 RepID=A0ABR3EU70_9AGAR